MIINPLQHEYRSAEIVERVLEKLWNEMEFKPLRKEKDSHLKFIKRLITFDKDLSEDPTLMKVVL